MRLTRVLLQPREALLRIGAKVDNDPQWTKGMWFFVIVEIIVESVSSMDPKSTKSCL